MGINIKMINVVSVKGRSLVNDVMDLVVFF